MWNTTLFIGWDEPGGTYDHVPPPPVEPPRRPRRSVRLRLRPLGLPGPGHHGVALGARRTVVTEEYRHTSMIATLRKVWDLGDKPLTRRDGSARTFDALFTLPSPVIPATGRRCDSPGPTDAADDPLTFRSSLGSLGRHLVHGMAHLCRAADHDVDARPVRPRSRIEVPQQVFMDAARDSAGTSSPGSSQRTRPTSDVPPGRADARGPATTVSVTLDSSAIGPADRVTPAGPVGTDRRLHLSRASTRWR